MPKKPIVRFDPFPSFAVAFACAYENAKQNRMAYKVQRCTCINQEKVHYMVTPGRMDSFFDHMRRTIDLDGRLPRGKVFYF